MMALEEIYTTLQEGKSYGYFYAMRFPVFHDCLWKHNDLICWSLFGSSANKNTMKELSWILDKIFRVTPEEFLKRYEVYSTSKMEEWERIADAQNTREYREWRDMK